MEKEKAKYLYYKSIIRKERLIEGLNTLSNEDYRLELLELFVMHYHLVGIFELGIKDIDDLLLKLSKEKRHYITYIESDYLYLKEHDKRDLLISMFYTRNIEDAKKMVLLTGVYDSTILCNIREKFGLEPLVELYKKTKEELILYSAYEWKDPIELYKNFLSYVDDSWTKKMIEKINSECKISDILEIENDLSLEDVIKMWHTHYKALTSENVYTIIRTGNYKEEDIEMLLDVLCKEKNPYYLYLLLTNDFKCDNVRAFDEKELERLQKALRESKNIEYNLYYDFYKNKEKLIEKFGSKINLLVYIAINKSIFQNTCEYSVIKNKLEEEIKIDACKSIDNDEINSFLFRDSEEEKSNSKKIVKKDKK